MFLIHIGQDDVTAASDAAGNGLADLAGTD